MENFSEVFNWSALGKLFKVMGSPNGIMGSIILFILIAVC